MVFASLLFYVLTACALFALRMRRPELVRPVRAFGYPWLPGFFLVFTAGIAVNLLIQKPQYTWPGLVIIALGIPMFLLRARHATNTPAS
jgi:APA family basic amino acid/polyamine antiporter